MEACKPAARDAFGADFCAADEARRASVSVKRSKEKDSHWRIWEDFCTTLAIDPHLQGIPQQLPFLAVFATRLRSGAITPSKKAITSKRVSDYLCTVGEEIASLGSQNPRFTINGELVLELKQLLKAWSIADPPPDRVKPVPVQLVSHAISSLDATIPFEAALPTC